MPSIFSKPFELACLLFIAGACVIPSGCAKPSPPRVEEKPIPIMPTPTPQTAAANSDSDFPPPEAEEVKQPVERVFKGAVTIQIDWNPYFFAGDFNGDLSKDLAVVVKPAPGRLLEINDELAAWILVDPVQFAKPIPKELPYYAVHAEKMKRRRVTVSEGDTLLAVIHGFQSKGWRDLLATQTHVLKGAVGAKMRVQARKQILWAGNEERMPRIWGDVITQSVDERHGFLYYNGAKYAWYDPRTYEPDAPTTMGHGRASRAMR